MHGTGRRRKLDRQSATVDSDPKLQKMNLNLVDCRHILSLALFFFVKGNLKRRDKVKITTFDFGPYSEGAMICHAVPLGAGVVVS